MKRFPFFASSLLLLLLLLCSGSHDVVAFAARTSMLGASSASILLTHHHHHHHLRHPRSQLSGPSTVAATLPSRTTTPLARPSSFASRSQATALALPRGGATTTTTSLAASLLSPSTPQGLFQTLLAGLALTTIALKGIFRIQQSIGESVTTDSNSQKKVAKPASVVSLQRKFLLVFWLLRCADWLQGPYFYEVYASKVLQGTGQTVSMSLVSKLFLTGFASTALFGPTVGRLADQYGRKKATLAFSVIYAIGALSTKSNVLTVLLLGRVLSGIGTSLLFSAPESWLVGAATSANQSNCLGETFGWAYAGDAIVAILAGVMAGQVAGPRGPTGPFELSTLFLGLGGLLTALLWNENKAEPPRAGGMPDQRPTIADAIQVVLKDPKILLLGGVQSLFEAAMYIMVLQWPPAMTAAFGAATPYGTIFSCFMASCLLGSTLFGQLTKLGVRTERFAAAMLSVATASMTAATWTLHSAARRQGTTASLGGTGLATLVASFFAFEACVGMYFPSIGTLRSRYVPDSHRSVIMNLFGIPLNVLVVSVFLSISKLGLTGALSVSSAALGVATLCMVGLTRLSGQSKEEKSAATAS